MNKVVITGMGVISPLGNDVETFFDNLAAGKNGISYIESFDASDSKVKLAAEVKDFSPEELFEKKEAKRMDRYCQFAMAASMYAMTDSKLDVGLCDEYRSGVIIGSGIGGMTTYESEHIKFIEKGAGRVSPLFIPMMISNIASGTVSIKYGFKGANFCPVTACASGAHAIGEAFRLIKHGYMDIVITGGAEATITPFAVAGFANMTALSTSDDPNAASLPFDIRRDGFVMGEGAGILVLESEQSAKKRNARIYAELAGYGATGDAYHITSPDPEGKGAARAMTDAINEAGIAPGDIDYINAHGTGTPLNDKFETTAIKAALGDHAYKTSISSTKSMTGHLLGAAGAIEAIISVMAINKGIVPPTINCIRPDPELDLDYTPLKARVKTVNNVISNSLGFGGHNAALLIRRYEG
ncbi:MAG: 3-oxoacyl-(acyl-carrier-protein) synthase 2 [Firmicutes bacterium ADurb.Bin193]|nr:MAG: 3-oxoacyl-(acyl-carrier-protein) synthase 2 [Firmicutes bacterium ADurb.Bin193]